MHFVPVTGNGCKDGTEHSSLCDSTVWARNLHICAKCATVGKVSDSTQRLEKRKETIKNVPISSFTESLSKF